MSNTTVIVVCTAVPLLLCGFLNYYAHKPWILYFPLLGLLLLIGYVGHLGIQWEMQKHAKANDTMPTTESPAVVTPKDLAEVQSPSPVTVNGDQINITAPNNSGTVIGKQTLVAPTGRHLTAGQKAILESAFMQFAGTKKLRVMVRMGDPEAYAYAQEISNCLPANSRTSLLQSMGKNWPGIIGIAVRNPDKPPACAEDVVNAFRTASIPVKKMFERSIPDESSVWVVVFFNQ